MDLPDLVRTEKLSARAPGMLRWLGRSPALRFFATGALLLLLRDAIAAKGGQETTNGAGRRIAMSARQIDEIAREQISRTGTAPSPYELELLREAAVDDEILFREALRRGLHEQDAVTVARLVRNMRFLGTPTSAPFKSTGPDGDAVAVIRSGSARLDDPRSANTRLTGQQPFMNAGDRSETIAIARNDDGPGDAELLRAALALGMHLSDPVVRRRMIELGRLDAYAAARKREPVREELEAFMHEHRDEFEIPRTVAFYHLRVGAAGGAASAEAARELLAGLAGSAPPQSAAYEPFASQSTVAKIYGAELAHAAMELPLHTWAGPLPSPSGAQLVWIAERKPSRMPALESVENRLRYAWEAARGDAELRRRLAELRRLYTVEWPDATSAQAKIAAGEVSSAAAQTASAGRQAGGAGVGAGGCAEPAVSGGEG